MCGMNVPPRTQQAIASLVACRLRLNTLRKEGCPEDSPVLCHELELEAQRAKTLCAAIDSEKNALPQIDVLLSSIHKAASRDATESAVEDGAVAAILLEGLSANLGG